MVRPVEVKEKISKTLTGRSHSEDRRLAIRQGVAKSPNTKNGRLKMAQKRGAHEFICIRLSDGLIVYQGFLKSECAVQIDCPVTQIAQVLQGVRKTVRGVYKCEYVDYVDPLVGQRVAKLKEQRRRHAKEKNKNLLTRLKADIRSRLSIAVRYSGRYKSGSSIDNLGCSIEELKVYLESIFLPGMTWENRGINGWHIDHIVPLVSFDLSNLEQLKKACHYTNLQPLWAIDNLQKGSKLPFLR